MKFIKKLMGQVDNETPEWDIKPPSERPIARKTTNFDEPLPTKKTPKDDHPFLGDDFTDTMTLEPESIPEDNPYQTYTWEQDPENDTRKLRTIQIGDKTEKPADAKFNPYDTGKMRRGWKK
jgi:hypothetical protein